MKLKPFCILTYSIAVAFCVLTLQPTAGHTIGVNTDVERQACVTLRSRAMRGNRQSSDGEISEAKRRALWIEYRDCLGGKDKNYLLPEEFKYK